MCLTTLSLSSFVSKYDEVHEIMNYFQLGDLLLLT